MLSRFNNIPCCAYPEPKLDKDIYIEQRKVEESEWVSGLKRYCNPHFVSYTKTANQVTFSFEKIRPFPEERLQVELRTGSFIIIENPCMEQLTQKYCRIWVLLSRLYLDYIQDVTSTSKDITPKMFKAFALQP